MPKIKDLVNAPAQKYEHMYNTMSSRDYTDSLLPPEIGIFKPGASPVPDVKSMKDELKNFLKNKIKDLENLFKKIRYVYLNIFNFVNNL